jgi:arginyl-tRNA synthetase
MDKVLVTYGFRTEAHYSWPLSSGQQGAPIAQLSSLFWVPFDGVSNLNSSWMPKVLYKAAKARFDEDEDFKARARQAVTLLQAGDPDHVGAWKRICEASRREFDAIYQRLGVVIQERGESFYNPRLAPIVEELLASGVAEESDGAKVRIPPDVVTLWNMCFFGGAVA